LIGCRDLYDIALVNACFFERMLCLAVAKWPKGPKLQLELKLDGYRGIGIKSKGRARGAAAQGTWGIEGTLPAPGIFEVRPPVALLTAHEARMSVACCATYPCSMLVTLGCGSCVLPAKVEAAAEITHSIRRYRSR
jgi:hypothetical protein